MCTLGNGYLATCGAAPESSANGIHYPGAAAGLERLLDELVRHLPEADRVQVGKIEMVATTSGQGRTYQVGQGSQHITER